MKNEHKEAIVSAVMSCDFSRILDKKFTVGDNLEGLSDVILAKSQAKQDETCDDKFTRLWRRARSAIEAYNMDLATEVLADLRALQIETRR